MAVRTQKLVFAAKHLLIILAFLILGSCGQGDLCFVNGGLFSAVTAQLSHSEGGQGMLLAQAGTQEKIFGMKSLLDFADEAATKGFRITNVKREQFVSLQVVGGGAQIVRSPVPLFGSTNQGVVYFNAILPTYLPRGRANIFIWNNGVETLIRRDAAAQNEVSAQAPLNRGMNYICFLVKVDNRVWGRSTVLRVESPGAEPPAAPPETPPSDFWDEANSKGLNPPAKQPIKGFITFSTGSRGNIITNIPSPLQGSTSEGVVDVNIVLPPDSPKGATVFFWNNGNESLIRRTSSPKDRILGQTVLARGPNYLCVFLKQNNSYWGRSSMVKVNSNVTASIARFELSWDGPGDVDLHLDSQNGQHVYYANRTLDQGGYRMNLDVDNMSGFGPENIRIFSLPSATNYRCFVNYYSGNARLNVTVRQFDKTNKLVKTFNKVFESGSARGSSSFDGSSWDVGTVTIQP